MSRKKKPANLKAVQVAVTMPRSFRDYISETQHGASVPLQQMVASSVLEGLMVQDFEDAYETRDLRFRKDPASQEFIRAARWILESKITEMRVSATHPGSLFLQVVWHLTGATTWVRVQRLMGDSLDDDHGFRHVIYDEEVEAPPKDAVRAPALVELSPHLNEGHCNHFRCWVLGAWLRFNNL